MGHSMIALMSGLEMAVAHAVDGVELARGACARIASLGDRAADRR